MTRPPPEFEVQIFEPPNARQPAMAARLERLKAEVRHAQDLHAAFARFREALFQKLGIDRREGRRE